MAIADWPADKLKRIRALLAEDAAVLVLEYGVDYEGGDGTTRSRTKLVRRWPRISDGDRADCEAFLRAYASAKNAEPGHTVTDPKADREVHPGTWRPTRTDLSRLKTDPNEQGVYQTLVCPADAADGDGAFPSEETHLNHVHTEVSSGAAPAQLHCGTPPKGKRLSASSRLDRETGEWESEVRTDEARGKKWTYTDGDALATTTHTREEHADAPPTVPAPVPGRIVRAEADFDEYGTYRTRVDETTAHEKSTGPYTASQNALQSTTEESVRNAKKAPSAGDNEAVSAHVNEFGLVDYNKRKTTPKPAEAQAEAAEWTEKTTSLAYQNADAEKSAIPGVADAHAIVPGATAHRNEFGKVDGSVTVTVPIERQSGPHTVEQTALRKVESTFHFNKASVPSATSSGGTATTYNPRVNRFGLIDYEERKSSPGTQGTNAWKRIYQAEWWTEHVYTMEFRNWTDIPKIADFGARDPLADKGVLSNHNVNYNDLDLFDGHLVLTVPVAQEGPEVVIEDSDQRKITAQDFFNQEQQPPADTSAPGSVTTYNARQNRFGLWDYEKRTVTFKPKDGAEYTSEAAFFGTTTVRQQLNQAAPANATDQTGAIQSVHNRLNDAGGYDTETRTERAAAKSSDKIVVENTPERKVTVQHFHNQATKPPDASHSPGNRTATLIAGANLNRFGLWDWEQRTVQDNGGYGEGYSYSYHTQWVPAVKEWKQISSRKGSYKIVKWSKKRLKVTITVKHHTTLAAAQGAINGQTGVDSAGISEGGTGIWYSHIQKSVEEWQD